MGGDKGEKNGIKSWDLLDFSFRMRDNFALILTADDAIECRLLSKKYNSIIAGISLYIMQRRV